MTERSEVVDWRSGAGTDRTSWVGERLGVRLVGPDGPLTLTDLAGLAVRRNPRRAHLVVSTVLGKHIPVDPRLSYAAARLLGEKAAALIGGPGRPAGESALVGALQGDADQLAKCCGPDDPGVSVPAPPLVLGYAETATGLGHAVADAFAGARYLHSTRRAVPGHAIIGTFDEAHSHATEHLLLPADPAWLRSGAPVVLVDDELTTGNTAAGTIRALHRIHPREHYVVAVLLDLRTAEQRDTLAAVAADLDTRIDVAALASGEVVLPEDLLTAAQSLVAAHDPAILDDHTPVHVSDRPRSRKICPAWPAGVPEGGRHGFDASHRAGLSAAVSALAAEVAAGLPSGRILVLGTEELMYTPLRLAMALTEHREHVLFSTTTRSPVLPVDAPGYAIRSRLRFAPPEPDPTGAPRFAYNVTSGFDAVVLVVDNVADTPELWAPGGLVEALRPETGALTVVVVPAVVP